MNVFVHILKMREKRQMLSLVARSVNQRTSTVRLVMK